MDQPAVRRSLPMVGALSAMAIAALAWWSFQTPPQRSLFEGLTDADKSAVVSALSASGINYSIDSSTGAVEVGEGDLQRARILLAGQGLPKAAPAGDALVANLPLGSSRAVEGETLRAAHEADLARTIEAIDSIKIARVHLATPDPSPFVRDERPPAASVMLTMQTGRTLSEAQVRAVQQLVSSSVSGLSPGDVSVVDQSGALMSRDASVANDQNFELQLQAEGRYRQALATLLTPMLGAGNYTAEVHADIDASESQSTRESYPQNDRALRSEQGNKTSAANANVPAAGIPGALSNQPPPASQLSNQPPPQQAAQSSNDNQSTETYSRSFDVGREISVTHQPEGRLHRLSVAVALNEADKKRTPAELAAIENLVKGAVGFDATRGDQVVVTSRPFAPVEESSVRFWESGWFLPLVRQVGALVAALFAFLFVGRPLMKSLRSRALGEEFASDGGEGAPGSQARLPTVTLDMIETAPSYEARADLVRNFVRQDREKAAMVVRQLVEARK
ncbi:flagellar basal-body MS-ring/collar protein FliF [Sphingomonas limnosediminicola]